LVELQLYHNTKQKKSKTKKQTNEDDEYDKTYNEVINASLGKEAVYFGDNKSVKSI